MLKSIRHIYNTGATEKGTYSVGHGVCKVDKLVVFKLKRSRWKKKRRRRLFIGLME